MAFFCEVALRRFTATFLLWTVATTSVNLHAAPMCGHEVDVGPIRAVEYLDGRILLYADEGPVSPLSVRDVADLARIAVRFPEFGFSLDVFSTDSPFQESDIFAADAVSLRIQTEGDSVAAAVRKQLSSEETQALSRGESLGTDTLARRLNLVREGPLLEEARDLEGAAEARVLNRFIIENYFPGGIARSFAKDYAIRFLPDDTFIRGVLTTSLEEGAARRSSAILNTLVETDTVLKRALSGEAVSSLSLGNPIFRCAAEIDEWLLAHGSLERFPFVAYYTYFDLELTPHDDQEPIRRWFDDPHLVVRTTTGVADIRVPDCAKWAAENISAQTDRLLDDTRFLRLRNLLVLFRAMVWAQSLLNLDPPEIAGNLMTREVPPPAVTHIPITVARGTSSQTIHFTGGVHFGETKPATRVVKARSPAERQSEREAGELVLCVDVSRVGAREYNIIDLSAVLGLIDPMSR